MAEAVGWIEGKSVEGFFDYIRPVNEADDPHLTFISPTEDRIIDAIQTVLK